MRPVLPLLLLAVLAPLAAEAGGNAPPADPLSEGVTLTWRSPAKLAVTARVALPNGCHQPVDATEATPQGAVAVANAVAVMVKIAVEGELCTQEYRIHRFDLTVDAPATAAGVIIYELRTGEPLKAALYPLPKRPAASR